jgi:hypothetical protein
MTEIGNRAPPDNAAPTTPSTAFAAAFNTIIAGYKSLGEIADRGAAYSLLTAGMVTLVSSIGLKLFVLVESVAAKDIPLTTGDLGVLVSGSVVLLFVGSGVRVWDRYMDDKASARDAHLRIEAAEKAASLLTGASPPQPTAPQQPRPAT